jgi:D-ribulokinase
MQPDARPQCLFLGIDFGTSGVRGNIINENSEELATAAIPLSPAPVENGRCEETIPERWREALSELLQQISQQIDIRMIKAIAIDGTSSTILLCDQHGEALSPALMYNDSRAREQAARIARIAPENSGAHGASSSLAKLMYLLEAFLPETHPDIPAAHACHQADWLQGWLSGHYDIADENNCLKLGYDSVQQCWPEWMADCGIGKELLPRVVAPGTITGCVLPERAQQFGLSEDCLVISGTTDSIAALIATGAKQIGDAVTALGSTLVLKLISDTPVFSATHGIYSHKLGEHWLVGGASNSGGAVLRKYFSQQQLDTMTPQLHPDHATGLHYYPLVSAGERFPHNDPDKAPILEPRPDDDLDFFQAILEGIADIEAEGYAKLQQLGASKAKQVYTTGGGSVSQPWSTIREIKLGIPVLKPEHSEASAGAALLAKQGWDTRG